VVIATSCKLIEKKIMKQERKKLHGNRVKNSDEPNNDKNEPK